MSASILIVDDEVSILNSLSSILEDEGYEVSVAKSGIEALKLCAVNPPELMMLDIWMPDRDDSPWRCADEWPGPPTLYRFRFRRRSGHDCSSDPPFQ